MEKCNGTNGDKNGTRKENRNTDKDTGLWIVVPKFVEEAQPCLKIISLNGIFRAPHLVPVHKTRSFIPRSLTMDKTLDKFKRFYINKFIDYHTFRIIAQAVSISFPVIFQSFSWRI